MNITIKNVPTRIHRLLRNRAKDSGRSINQEVIACLAEKLEPTRVDVDQLLRSAADLHMLNPRKTSLAQMQEDLEAA
jgi:plasmid stability protein